MSRVRADDGRREAPVPPPLRDRGHRPRRLPGKSASRLVRRPTRSPRGTLFPGVRRVGLGVLFFVYWTSADFVERQTEATLDAEITGLAEQYAQRGLSGLVQIVAARSAGDRGDAMLYLITDPDGRPLAGNIAGWPAGVPARTGWLSFSVESKSKGDERDRPGARPPVRHFRGLSPAGRPRHQRRGGVPRQGQDDAVVVRAGRARRRAAWAAP